MTSKPTYLYPLNAALFMNIRPARLEEFEGLYEMGRNTPELRVSATEQFMDKDDFRQRIENPSHIFLVAEQEERVIGFICASTKDEDRPLQNRYACLVYIAILPEFRRQGVAQRLYTECERQLKERNITHFYGWANIEGKGEIIQFLEKQGFAQGHKYLWMDKKL